MKKTILYIEGMHCVSCEVLLEKEFSKIRGLKSCKISHKKGDAEIECIENVPMEKLKAAVHKCGYTLAEEREKKRSREKRPDYAQIVLIAIGIGVLFWLIARMGVSQLFPDFGDKIGILVAFPIGIAASLSTCLALTGGIVMSFGATIDVHEGKKRHFLVRALPHLYFHAGRVGGFALLGGLLGFLGSKLDYSLTFTGYLTVVVAIMMFYMGLSILGIVPNITKFGLHLPKSWGNRIHKMRATDHHIMPALIGALTFFLPCGFTQTMQIAAAASQSFVTGALLMAMFALGTMPVLLSIGVGSTYAHKDKMQFFYRVIGVVVLYFALYSFNSGLVLAGSPYSVDLWKSGGGSAESTIKNGVQVVEMNVDWTFSPTEFRVKKGVPVLWKIYGINLTGCSNEIVIPSLNIRKKLVKGLNEVRFTPEKEGIIPFSCWMGMIPGRFIVTDEAGQISSETQRQALQPMQASECDGSCGGSCNGGSGCGGGCGGR